MLDENEMTQLEIYEHIMEKIQMILCNLVLEEEISASFKLGQLHQYVNQLYSEIEHDKEENDGN